MTDAQADRQNAEAWRDAGRRALLACALTLIAASGAHAAAPSADAGASPQRDSEAHPVVAQASGKPGSRDALFGDPPPAADKPQATRGWTGFIQSEGAYTYPNSDHWSKGRLRLDATRQGQFNENVKWKIGGRLDYDAAYDLGNYYAPEVRRDQRYEFMLRENYLDISTAGNWEFRFGRQHIVWGEMVGLFIADVVSARDMREFILPEPELQILRIPQWAARAEYFGKDMKFEVLWIPYPSYDEIGKPGIPGVKGAAPADFFPFPIPGPGGTLFLGEDRPTRKFSNTSAGARVSGLASGWDWSGFYYHSMDITPTFYRQVLPGPTPATPVFLYQARHDKIDQAGGTFSKDLGNAVIKGEAVYTTGRSFSVTRITQPNGVVELDTIDWAVGADFTLPKDVRLNVQLFQRAFLDYDSALIEKRYESGVSVLFDAIPLAPNLEGRLLVVHSLNRSDYLVRPKVTWTFEKNWRLSAGVDIFGGPATGLFGRYDNNDRVYAELRYSF